MSYDPSLGGSKLGGGPYNGYVPRQTITSQKDSEFTASRRVLRGSWGSMWLMNSINGQKRIVTPFRAVNNSGDYLGRVDYSCGGPNPLHGSKPGYSRRAGKGPQQCDATGVQAASCNPKFVADSSDYIRFKKLSAVNKTYNDLGYGGANNGHYTFLMHVRRR